MDDKQKIAAALEMCECGAFDGDHHKMWAIDQVVRILCGSDEAYAQWVKEYCDGEDGPDTYEWDTGIAP